MRCEMACAATHMTWEATSCPPASCALAARGAAKRRHGALATLMRLLAMRALPPGKQRTARACPCQRPSDEWYY